MWFTAGDNRVKQTQSRLTKRGLGTRGVVQTNPIPAAMPIRRSAFPGGWIVPNKANSVRGLKEPSACRETSYGGLDMHGTSAKQSQFPGGDTRDAAWRTWDEGCCTNKPNSCHWADREIGLPGRVDCAKQSQFGPAPSCNRVQWRQTNPIQPGRRAGRVPGRAKCAKRTQSPPDRPVRWGWNRPLALGYSPCYVTQPGLGTQTAPLGWWKWHRLVK
jgi:hypothetical protein